MLGAGRQPKNRLRVTSPWQHHTGVPEAISSAQSTHLHCVGSHSKETAVPGHCDAVLPLHTTATEQGCVAASEKRKYRKNREKLNEPGFSPPSLILSAKLLSREWIIPALDNPQQHQATGGGEIRSFSCWLPAFQGVFYLFKKPHSSSS